MTNVTSKLGLIALVAITSCDPVEASDCPNGHVTVTDPDEEMYCTRFAGTKAFFRYTVRGETRIECVEKTK